MGRIQHLAIASQDPEKQAEFYKSELPLQAFGQVQGLRERPVRHRR